MRKDHEARRDIGRKRPQFCGDPGRSPVIAPGFDKNWEDRLKNRLVGLGEQLAEGDSSVLRRAHPVPPTATTGQALEPSLVTCEDFPYLVSLDDNNSPFYDRFAWWTKDGTTAGANVVPPPTGYIDKEFECEFNRPLVTIVGGNSPDDPLPADFDVLAWDDFNSPNEVPGIQFTTRVQHFLPNEPSALGITAFNGTTRRDGHVRPRKVVLNGGLPDLRGYPAGGVLPRGQFRSSLVFEFHVPQRAVGIEFGYRSLPAGDRPLSAVGVILYAYDRQGQQITNSDAGRIDKVPRQADEPLLRPDSVRQRVGVRDQNGNISSVELRFESVHAHDANGTRMLEEQVVYRVWHESLPPAVVLQDRIMRESGPNAAPPETKSFNLPYHCDQALVLMRGFKLEFLDGQSHSFLSIPASLETPQGDPPIYDVGRGGQIQFVVRGDLTNANEPFGRRVTADYTVLAWDSQQIDLFTRPVDDQEQSTQSDLHSGVGFSRSVDQPGRLFGALQGFSFDFGVGRLQGINRIWLAVGRFWGGPCFLDYDVDQETTLGPTFGGSHLVVLTYTSPGLAWMPASGNAGVIQVSWDICTQVMGDDHDDYSRRVKGTIVGGGSLTLPDVTGMANAAVVPRGPRPDPNDFFGALEFPVGDGPTGPDMLVLGLESFFFDPHKAVQQLDIEVRAKSFDGSTLIWGMGGGMSGNDGGIFAVPAIATLVRKSRYQKGDLVVQDLFFDTVVGIASDPAPNGQGAIRNVGTGMILLSNLVVDDAGGLFDYRFLWNGNLYTVSDLTGMLPLQLDPQAVLLVGGRYTPIAVAGEPTAAPPIPPNHGTVALQTNSPRQPLATVQAWGVALPSEADGNWLIPSLDFGGVNPNQTKTLADLLLSTGQTPLVVNDLRLQQPGAGFDFELAPVVESDGLSVLVTYTERRAYPDNLQAARNHLFADTNAGLKPLPLIAGGIRLDPPGIGG